MENEGVCCIGEEGGKCPPKSKDGASSSDQGWQWGEADQPLMSIVQRAVQRMRAVRAVAGRRYDADSSGAEAGGGDVSCRGRKGNSSCRG